METTEHQGLISSHPGEDRDTDSEDEETKMQAPVPIQDEPIEEDKEDKEEQQGVTPSANETGEADNED